MPSFPNSLFINNRLIKPFSGLRIFCHFTFSELIPEPVSFDSVVIPIERLFFVFFFTIFRGDEDALYHSNNPVCSLVARSAHDSRDGRLRAFVIDRGSGHSDFRHFFREKIILDITVAENGRTIGNSFPFPADDLSLKTHDELFSMEYSVTLSEQFHPVKKP